MLVVLTLASTVLLAQQEQPLRYKLPGRMVDIGGYRLHIDCKGRGAPTVIFENGLGDIFADWALVQPGVAHFARACSYDRAYEGFSDPGPIPVTMHQQVFELHLLLEKASMHPPYLLVGHSYGGMVVRLFAMTYSKEVAGLVLVDALHEDIKLGDKMFRSMATGKTVPPPQTMQSSPPLPYTPQEQAIVDRRTKQLQDEARQPVSPPLNKLPPQALQFHLWAEAHPKLPSTAKGFQETWLPEELQQIHESREGNIHPLGDTPIFVIGVARDNPVSLEERRVQLDDMASLSTDSKVGIDSRSGHHVQWEDPDFVVSAVRDVCTAAKHRVGLPK